MSERQVVIFVPYDGGFSGDGGGPLFLDFISFAASCLEWMLHPLKNWRAKREEDRLEAEWEEKNLRAGLNRDGSYAQSFPATMPLREALESLGFDTAKAARGKDSMVKRFDLIPLGQLLPQEINEAVLECQIANW